MEQLYLFPGLAPVPKAPKAPKPPKAPKRKAPTETQRALRECVDAMEGSATGSTAFEHAEALAVLLRSVAHIKFKRGGMTVAREALEFFGASHSHTREQRAAARERVRDVLRLAEEWITTHGPIVFGDLRVTLSDVLGLVGLQIMLAKKFARELEAP